LKQILGKKGTPVERQGHKVWVYGDKL